MSGCRWLGGGGGRWVKAVGLVAVGEGMWWWLLRRGWCAGLEGQGARWVEWWRLGGAWIWPMGN